MVYSIKRCTLRTFDISRCCKCYFYYSRPVLWIRQQRAKSCRERLEWCWSTSAASYSRKSYNGIKSKEQKAVDRERLEWCWSTSAASYSRKSYNGIKSKEQK